MTPDSNTRNEALDIILDNYEVWLSWEGETLNNNHGKSRAETYEAISLLLQEAEDRGYKRGYESALEAEYQYQEGITGAAERLRGEK